jgi:hypothetical protein
MEESLIDESVIDGSVIGEWELLWPVVLRIL